MAGWDSDLSIDNVVGLLGMGIVGTLSTAVAAVDNGGNCKEVVGSGCVDGIGLITGD